MPNINRSDHVPLHAHSARDIAGVQRAGAGPPTLPVVGTTAGPTRTANTFADLEEMTITVPATYLPRSVAERWQITARFTGMFSHSNAGNPVSVVLVQDDTLVSRTQRIQSSTLDTGKFTHRTFATLEVAAETATTIKVQWANDGGVGTATATGVQRRLELDFKPLTGT